jgi:hypothetical protein
MSLVGSLEDLGLGDILQIISLSGKSGILLLRSDRGEGRIVFRKGLIRGASYEGGPTDLRELVAGLETVPQAELDTACERARAQSVSLATVLIDRSLVNAESLEKLRRENLEDSVMYMFGWGSGEFSFEVLDAIPDEEIFSSTGVNAQYLALDFTRLADERECETDEDPCCDSLVFDGDGGSQGGGEMERLAHAADDVAGAAERGAVGAEDAIVTVQETDSTEGPTIAAEPTPQSEPLPATGASSDAPPPGLAPIRSPVLPPVVAIDADLAALEWVKQGLADAFPRIHIFQRSELGIGRIRQYLARAEVPLVLLSANAPADPLSGAQDFIEMIRRLKAQAERMPIVLLAEPGADPLSGRGKASRPDAVAERPTASQFADPRCAPQRTEYLEGLLEVLAACTCERNAAADLHSSAAVSLSPGSLLRLKEVSARMRDPSSSGEVLPHVLHFASEMFSRVAMFMIRDGTARGIAQVGLPKAGGPDEPGLRGVVLPHREPAWFRRALDSRGPVRAAPSGDGDQRLAVLLGNAIPDEAYVAPIESGEQVIALLYADNLPGDEPIGDTSALEVVLHEAGLALDRAWLERALEEAEG